MKIIREEFDSLKSLITTLDKRPNTLIMQREHSSITGDESFTGTKSYDEAISLLRYGYAEPIPQIKDGLTKNKRVVSDMVQLFPRSMPCNHVVGYVPNVPNALRGLPQSMISVERQLRKRKTLCILYSFGTSAMVETKDIIKAGIALVTAINITELSGIQTKLDLSFMPAMETKEVTFPTVTIKNYGERFALQKICFPLIHPSMFRRIGFKYLETCPDITEDFSCGYGRPVPDEILQRELNDNEHRVISLNWIIRHKYNVEAILKELTVIK